jgi:hypothetical protein
MPVEITGAWFRAQKGIAGRIVLGVVCAGAPGSSQDKPKPGLLRSGEERTPATSGYCLNTNLGPLTRFPLRSTITSTRSAIFTKGMPLFMP